MNARRIFLKAAVLASIAVLLFWVAGAAGAHELRPGVLELREGQPGTYSLLWKRPAVPVPVMSASEPAGREHRVVRRAQQHAVAGDDAHVLHEHVGDAVGSLL